MFRSIVFFEIKYYLKQPLFYGIALFLMFMTFSAVTSDSVQMGGAIGNINRNAPTVIIQLLNIVSVMGVFIATAYVASSLLRDFTRETHELFFSRPIRKFDYLLHLDIAGDILPTMADENTDAAHNTPPSESRIIPRLPPRTAAAQSV